MEWTIQRTGTRTIEESNHPAHNERRIRQVPQVEAVSDLKRVGMGKCDESAASCPSDIMMKSLDTMPEDYVKVKGQIERCSHDVFLT